MILLDNLRKEMIERDFAMRTLVIVLKDGTMLEFPGCEVRPGETDVELEIVFGPELRGVFGLVNLAGYFWKDSL